MCIRDRPKTSPAIARPVNGSPFRERKERMIAATPKMIESGKAIQAQRESVPMIPQIREAVAVPFGCLTGLPPGILPLFLPFPLSLIHI